MKKFYTLLLAAGVAASVSAAVSTEYRTPKARTLPIPVASASDITWEKSMRAAAEAPTTLDNTTAVCNFTMVEDEYDANDKPTGNTLYLPATNILTFTNETPHPEYTNVKNYTVNNFYEGIYNPAVIVAPDFTIGLIDGGDLLFDTDQTFLIYKSPTGDIELAIWVECSNGYLYKSELIMEYVDGEFVFPKTLNVKGADGNPTTVDILTLYTGYVAEQGKGVTVYTELTPEFSIRPVPYSGTMNWIMTNNAGPQNRTAKLGADIEGTTLTVYNFAGSINCPMEIDSEAKTLTATDVEYNLSDYDGYLSEENPADVNAAGKGNYVLKSTYTVAEGKTTVTVPNWNSFANLAMMGEFALLWPMTETTIVLDFDLDEAYEAGIQGVSADAAVVEGPAKYYNLQGMEVSNPANGQIVIKVQGNKATKMVVR